MLAEEGLLGSVSKTLASWTQLLPEGHSRSLASHLKCNAVKHRQLNGKNGLSHAFLNFFVTVGKKVRGESPTHFKLLSEWAAPSTERFQKPYKPLAKAQNGQGSDFGYQLHRHAEH